MFKWKPDFDQAADEYQKAGKWSLFCKLHQINSHYIFSLNSDMLQVD